MRDFAVIDFPEEETVGMAPTTWLVGEADIGETIQVNWETNSRKGGSTITKCHGKILFLTDDEEEAKEKLDDIIHKGKTSAHSTSSKRKSTTIDSDDSDDENLREKQKRMRYSITEAQKQLKDKLQVKMAETRAETQDHSKDKQATDQSTEEDIVQKISDALCSETISPEEDVQKICDAPCSETTSTDEDVQKICDAPCSETVVPDSQDVVPCMSTPKSIPQNEPLIVVETPQRVSSVPMFGKPRRPLVPRIVPDIKNYSDTDTDDSDSDTPLLTKEQLRYKITALQYDMKKMRKENEKLQKENNNLRDTLSIMNELPELLQKIRTVKGKGSQQSSQPQQPSPQSQASPQNRTHSANSSVMQKTSPVPPKTSPIQTISPTPPSESSSPLAGFSVSRQPLTALHAGNNETIPFGSKEVSKKELSCIDFRKPSAVVKFLMESLFEEEELANSSVTGSHGGTRKGQESKPGLDKETVLSIVEFTKSHCRISEEEVKKIMRIRLNNVQKKMKKPIED